MAKGRILFVCQEITPFTPESDNAYYNRYMPAHSLEKGRDIRVFTPRFSYINERRNQLHEVIRLSGMNLILNNCDHQLIIKVGSIPSARMQVYFIDNEEYFMDRGGLYDETGTPYADNDERSLFFCRGTLEAVRKLSWQPHLINFSGWFGAMIPFYLRRLNKENAFYNGTKTVMTLLNDQFPGQLGTDLERKMKADGATAKDLRLYGENNYIGLMKAAMTYASGVVIASDKVPQELVDFARENKRHLVEYTADKTELYDKTNKMYDTLIGSNINN